MANPGPSGKSLKQVDLDQIFQEFDMWQKYTIETGQQKHALEGELENLVKLLSTSRDKERVLQEDLHGVRRMIDKLQRTLTKRCDMEDENKNLKSRVTTLKDKIKKQAKLEHEKRGELKQNMEDLQSTHKAELTHMQETAKVKAEAEKSVLRKSVDEKCAQIEQLHKQLAELERDKQGQLMKLRLEYDAKMLKLQKQTAKNLQAGHSSSANQDIFRKKLQHVKGEYEKELSQLRRTVSELQQQLALQEKPVQPSRVTGARSNQTGPGPTGLRSNQSNQGGPGPSKRTRRY